MRRVGVGGRCACGRRRAPPTGKEKSVGCPVIHHRPGEAGSSLSRIPRCIAGRSRRRATRPATRALSLAPVVLDGVRTPSPGRRTPTTSFSFRKACFGRGVATGLRHSSLSWNQPSETLQRMAITASFCGTFRRHFWAQRIASRSFTTFDASWPHAERSRVGGTGHPGAFVSDRPPPVPEPEPIQLFGNRPRCVRWEVRTDQPTIANSSLCHAEPCRR